MTVGQAAGTADLTDDAHPDLGGTPADSSALHWEASAIARLMRVPEGFMRDTTRNRIEDYARETGAPRVTLEVAEGGLEKARKAMQVTLEGKGQDDPDGRTGIFAQRYNPLGEPEGPEFQVNTFTLDHQANAAIAMSNLAFLGLALLTVGLLSCSESASQRDPEVEPPVPELPEILQ